MSRPARVDYDLEAAKANLERVRVLAPRQKIMAIIKADAYGHGLDRMAGAFSAADAFGVACLDEAQGLRDRGVKHPIVLLEGPFSLGELREMQRLALDIVIHHDEQIAMLRHLPEEHSLGVWLKVDSGMHRLGFAPQRVRGAWEELQ
ncbi:MAG: alanine racemase, partial [Gammaproteobacteria bacterium]